jgi:hydroxymethylbilane synthase
VAAELSRWFPAYPVELVEIRTQGDRDRNSPLAAIGGQGLFTKEIQRRLVEGAIDLAVHSLKDLPTTGPAELVLAAVPEREAIADALIAPACQTLARLPEGARVGTSSLRRRAMLLHARPDLRIENLRGNVETRLSAALTGALDAVVLAEAGLRRLGLEAHITESLAPPDFLPAVGQGALGIECRGDDRELVELLAMLDHPPTHASVAAERALLAALEGGCVVPIGAWARPGLGGFLRLDAAVYAPDGAERLMGSGQGSARDPGALGRMVAADLVRHGAERLLGRT